MSYKFGKFSITILLLIWFTNQKTSVQTLTVIVYHLSYFLTTQIFNPHEISFQVLQAIPVDISDSTNGWGTI